MIAAIALIALISIAIAWTFPAHWHISQALGMLGANQLWLFNDWYGLFFAAVVFLFGLAVVRGADLSTIEGHLYLITAAIVFCVPFLIQLPWYQGPLSFITHRMSLAAAIPLLAIIAQAGFPKPAQWAIVALSITYFSALYHATSEIDRIESALHEAVRHAPKGARVAASMPDSSARIYPYGHLIDRACIGHCFSYGNYEPATAQFRVRVNGPNPYVAHDTKMSLDLQTAVHTVTPHDAPLYMFEWTGSAFELRILQPGDRMSD